MSKLSEKYPGSLFDITDIPMGTVLRDWYDEGVRVILMRSTSSINVYLGVSKDHPLTGFDYDSLPLECHGGLTFSSEGDDEYLPKGLWWYGYDYAHASDKVWYDKAITGLAGRTWSIEEIEKDAWTTIYEFKKLVTLAERIAQSGRTYQMNTTKKEPLKVEMIISTYWPTKVIKSIQLKEAGKDTYRNDITQPKTLNTSTNNSRQFSENLMSKQPDEVLREKVLHVNRINEKYKPDNIVLVTVDDIIEIFHELVPYTMKMFDDLQANYTPNHLVEQRCLEARIDEHDVIDKYLGLDQDTPRGRKRIIFSEDLPVRRDTIQAQLTNLQNKEEK